MTVLTRARMTGLWKPLRALDAPIAASAVIYKGATCGFKGGYLVPWADNDPDISHPCIAIPELVDVVDNTGGSDGDLSCPIDFGHDKICYLFANDNVSALAQANIGGDAWGKDDQTVSASSASGARSRIGTPWIVQTTNARGFRTGVYVELEGPGGEAALIAMLASTASGDGASLVGVQDAALRFVGANGETVFAEIGGRIIYPVADATALGAIVAATRVDGQIAVKLDDDTIWTFDSGSSASASDWVIAPAAGTGRWLRNHVSLDDLVTLNIPAMQAVNATLSSGTITINSGIVVASTSEVIPLQIGAITGSTNFGSLRELKSSRVNGAAGVGTVVIEAVGNDGAKDVDAAGAIRVVILTPAV